MTRWSELARRARDDRGSLPMVLLVTIVGMLLTGLLVPVLLNQAHTTRFDASRVTSLDAAQAGTDLALGKIRNARDAQGNGDATKLPCGPITGSVDAGGGAGYQVTIKYYTTDPTGTTTANPMSCIDGYGTYDGASGVATPSWAQLTSIGTGGGGNGASKGRTLVTTYGFKMDNTNVPSGVIRIFPATGTSAPLCLDAGNATTSTSVMLQPCSTTVPVAAPQAFVYRTDLTLQLQSSVSGSNANGNCLTYPSSDGVNPTSGATVTLAACQSLGHPAWNQQWSFDDNGHFRASLSTSKNSPGNLSSLCMDVATQVATTVPTLQSCAGGTSDGRQAWIPAPAVGAGAAAPPQWVNYFEFGRCLDVTNQDVNKPFLIDYPCKQNPYPGAVAWNQKFTAPTIPAGAVSATGPFYTTKSDGSKYCLTSPGSRGGLVVVKTCNQPGQIWTVYNNDDSLGYTKKFTIADSSTPNLCLGLTDPQEGMVWSALDVDTCVGRADQKWNADPTMASNLNTQEN